jgi:hypothetical protein
MKSVEGKRVNVDVATSYGTVAPNHIGLREIWLDAGRALMSKIKPRLSVFLFILIQLCSPSGVVSNSWIPHASNVACTPTKTNTVSDRNADCCF